MNSAFFQMQVNRLITRFGQKALDPEFIKLAWREVHDMSETGFARFVDVMIGSRTANKPPLLSEFREARINEQKRKFDEDIRGAAQALRKVPPEMRKHLKDLLMREYGGCDGVIDALEVAKFRFLLVQGEKE